MHEEIDGIKQNDNKIPTGWMMFYIAGLIYIVVYVILYVPEFGGESWNAKHDQEMKEFRAEQQAKLAAAPKGNPFKGKEAAVLAEGEEIYNTNCASCHQGNLKGNQAFPSLVAEKLIHGSSEEELYNSIATGYPEKGMPGWEAALGNKRVWKVLTFIESKRK